MGFEVEQAYSGLEALDRLRESMVQQRLFGLLLLDWHMPGMDGIELAGHIRSLGMAQVPQMLMVTAYGREDVMRAARAQGIERRAAARGSARGPARRPRRRIRHDAGR